MTVLRLAIPCPLRRVFDYLPPTGMQNDTLRALPAGIRLLVPFGSRQVIGYLLAVCDDSETAVTALKPALQVLDYVPLVEQPLLTLCQWAADYYHHPIGEVYNTLFPKRLRDGRQPQQQGTPGYRLTARGKGLPPQALSQSPRQAQAVKMLQQQETIATATFKDSGISAAILRSLRDKALIAQCTLNLPIEAPTINAALQLNAEQAAALATLRASQHGFYCHLLEGVTGSGKTEVYLQLMADYLRRGSQILVLVPEIGLTPQILARLQERFDCNIAVLHSAMSDAQRYAAWEAARNGTAHIVVGTRSAVFTPFATLGLIVVDEEHDASYKQQDGFRYSARDVAVKRAQLHACPILLGSATPSLESIQNTLTERYQLLQLTQRTSPGGMPDIETLDIRRQALQGGLSTTLITAINETLQRGQQVLLFLNRRGYAPTLQCHDCGWIAECHSCDARLTVHRRRHRLRCHHCGASHPLVNQCPRCHSKKLLAAGLGTEQTEDFLHAHFSAWPIFRVDSDSMQSRHAMRALAAEVNRGEPGILLGTQMLTKGHHFPGVTLVAVIDADALLFSADFRGEERMAQLLTQVAGRAGRADIRGKVLLQTHYPDHPTLTAMLHSSYANLSRAMLLARQEAGMPPAGQLAILRTDCADARYGEQFLQDLKTDCVSSLPPGAAIVGPLPSPMQRRAGKYRSQLLVTAPNRAVARAAASLLVATAETRSVRFALKWSIDIDPQEVF